MRWEAIKDFTPEVLGLSCCFRQWRATESHCSQLHGYALGVRLRFSAEQLDRRNWVIDFGSFGPVKDYLKETFDHRLLVAADDPELVMFRELAGAGVANLLVVNATGCEAFSWVVAQYVSRWVGELEFKEKRGLRLDNACVYEHHANWGGVAL